MVLRLGPTARHSSADVLSMKSEGSTQPLSSPTDGHLSALLQRGGAGTFIRCHSGSDNAGTKLQNRYESTGPVRSLRCEPRLDAVARRLLLAQQEILDAARKEEAGGSVEATPTEAPANTEPAELRQGAGTWAGGGQMGRVILPLGVTVTGNVNIYNCTSFL